MIQFISKGVLLKLFKWEQILYPILSKQNSMNTRLCDSLLMKYTFSLNIFIFNFFKFEKISYMGQQMKKGVSTHCSYSQSNKEREKEFEASLINDGHQDHAQQGKQANDSDRNDATNPCCRKEININISMTKSINKVPKKNKHKINESQTIDSLTQTMLLKKLYFGTAVFKNKTKSHQTNLNT